MHLSPSSPTAFAVPVGTHGRAAQCDGPGAALAAAGRPAASPRRRRAGAAPARMPAAATHAAAAAAACAGAAGVTRARDRGGRPRAPMARARRLGRAVSACAHAGRAAAGGHIRLTAAVVPVGPTAAIRNLRRHVCALRRRVPAARGATSAGRARRPGPRRPRPGRLVRGRAAGGLPGRGRPRVPWLGWPVAGAPGGHVAAGAAALGGATGAAGVRRSLPPALRRVPCAGLGCAAASGGQRPDVAAALTPQGLSWQADCMCWLCQTPEAAALAAPARTATHITLIWGLFGTALVPKYVIFTTYKECSTRKPFVI